MFRIYRGEWVTAKLANGSNAPKNKSIKNCILNKKFNLMRQTQINSAPDQHEGLSLSLSSSYIRPSRCNWCSM
jgi:hypothetical protein